MQRYRVNYVLLFGVVAGSLFVAAVAFFLVHPWQVNRKASWFLERANEAFAENNLREAFDYQNKYVQYRSDEDEARIKLAHLAVDVSKLDDATREEYGNAYRILDAAVRRTGDLELRRLFADMLITIGRPQDALVQIQELLDEDPNNTELQSLRIRALFLTKDFRRATKLALKIIGYDEKTEEFDPEKATAADQPDIYARLAAVLQEKSNTQELARRVIDRLVEVNPESSDAYLKRAVFLYGINETEEADIALDKAYELAPTDAAVLERKGQVALVEEDFDVAKEFFEKALELYPDKVKLYQLMAYTEVRREHVEEAIAILDKGIERFDERQSLQLLIAKIDLSFQVKDLDAAKKEIDTLADVKFAQRSALKPLIDFQRARVKWEEKKWVEAAKELKRVRPLLTNSSREQILAGYLLGNSYENQGKYDLALQSYSLVLQTQPNYGPAQAGRARMRKRLRPDEIADSDSFNIDQLVKKMLGLPEDKQKWDQIDENLVKYAKERNLPEVSLPLLRAQVFLSRKMYSEAEQLIKEAVNIDPENASVRFAEVKLIFATPDGGPEKALDQLKKTVEQFGASIQSRSLRIEILLALNEENVVEKLRALTEGTQDWDTSEQVQLFQRLGTAFQRLKLPADAIQYWKSAAELDPNNLPILTHLFELVLQEQDDDAAREVQEKILKLVGDKNDASYILTEVKRRLIGYEREKVSLEEVQECRGLLDAALKRRPEWSELHVLYGQMLILLKGDVDLALQHLDDALKYGPANFSAVGMQVKLLAGRGRIKEARDVMNRLPEAIRAKVLGGTEAELLLATGDKEGAFKVAEGIANERQQDEKTQKWFAKLAQKSGNLEAAAAAYQKAAALVPGDVENWSQLLGIYATLRKSGELVEVFRRAQLSLDAEFLPLLAAKSFELRGQWKNAEKIYLAAFSGRYDEVAVARRIADFYLLWSSADPTYRQKAASFINRILRATYEGKIPSDHPQAAWARIQAARQLAATGKYQDSLTAQQLIAQGAVDGKLPVADQVLLAEILASLNDPASQGKAIRLFTELHKNRQLEKKDVLLLARLLRNSNQWERCEELMLDLLGTFGSDTQVWSAYVGMLIERGDYSNAQSRINRLKRLDPQGISYLQLQAKLAFEEGDKKLVRKSLMALLPKDLKGKLDAERLQLVHAIAQLAIQCEDFEMAGKLFQLYVKHLPEKGFELLQFHAMYGDIEKAMPLLKSEFSNHINQVLSLVTQMLRKRRTEFGDRFDSDIDQMIAQGLRDDPDSAQRLLFKAEILEIEQKYQQSAEAYDKMLKRDDLPPLIRAAAMNNLAFLLALLEERLDEAKHLVQQAMEIYGPIDALLDTQALISIAGKDYESAVKDLKLAVTVGRDPIKYYHLARAQMLAGDKEESLKSWNVAKDLGIEKDQLPIIEQHGYEKFESTIGQPGQTQTQLRRGAYPLAKTACFDPTFGPRIFQSVVPPMPQG